MKDLLNLAVDILKTGKVGYGDARIGFYRWQNLYARNFIMTNIANDRSDGIGIRAHVPGGWGFASSSELTRESVERTALRAIEIAQASALTATNGFSFASEKPRTLVWETAYRIDPFKVPIPEKVEFLLAINRKILEHSGIKQAVSSMDFGREHKLFMNTEGTYSDQLILRVSAQYTATAVGPEGFESRTFPLIPLNTGYEHIVNTPFLETIPDIAGQAVRKLKAPFCRQEETDLILLPSHTALTIHETIGHATELDRVMGWEADMAGTSFATLDKLGRLKYGSEIFNVVADRTMENGRASVPLDDEGVQTGRWHIIKNGILKGYATTRSTAHFIGETRSRGCSFADSWNSNPILRMPNVSIESGPPGSPSLDELIADTSNGVLVDGMGSFSIDHQRINFQFGGDCAWRINKGRLENIIRRFTYQSHNPVFWNSVDCICNQNEWKPYGVINCGKGQPMQRAQLTHGSAPLRLRNITVGKARI
ncbi:TldD/PmbA family protein [bacterium]|nr:TldD/PmbA family protein [candidate division CSSED10-310 bacterium]